MINQNVVLSKISGSIEDITYKVTDVSHAGASLTLTSSDAIYIGSELPFNSLYIRLGAQVNNNAANLKYAFYTGNEFVDFTRILDGTNTLAKSGVVNLIAADTKSPSAQDTKNITELAIEGYYGLYWTKISPSASLDVIDFKYFGQLFLESDQALFMEYPELSNPSFYKTFGLIDGKNKIDWLDQRIVATDRVIADLIARGFVVSGDQFLDWRLMKEATIHKCAEIIYKSQGQRYKEDYLVANKAYQLSLENKKFSVAKAPVIVKNSSTRQVPRSARFVR